MTYPQSIYKFLLKTLLALLPLWLLVAVYVAIDPFDMLRPPAHPYPRPAGMPYSISMANFQVLKSLPDSLRPNAFIFGSSRSRNFPVKAWTRHLPLDARPFHLDGSAETTDVILRKLRWLKANGYDVKYALIELSSESFAPMPVGVSFEQPSEISTISEVISAQYRSLRFFLDKDVLLGCMRFISTGADDSFQFPLTPEVSSFDPLTNESIQPSDLLVCSAPHYLGPEIQTPIPADISRSKADLKEIVDILASQRADYHFIVSPILTEAPDTNNYYILFPRRAAGRIHNFTSTHFTYNIVADTTNWIDRAHYSPLIAARFIDRAYSK